MKSLFVKQFTAEMNIIMNVAGRLQIFAALAKKEGQNVKIYSADKGFFAVPLRIDAGRSGKLLGEMECPPENYLEYWESSDYEKAWEETSHIPRED